MRTNLQSILLLILISGLLPASVSDDLYQAIRDNNLPRLRTIPKDSPDVNARDPHGETPLMYAAFTGSLEAMQLLIDKGADVNAQNDFGSTPLIWCATDIAKVKLLLDHNANVNLSSKKGRNALLV